MGSRGGSFFSGVLGAVIGSALTIAVLSQNIIPGFDMNPAPSDPLGPSTITVEGEVVESIYKAVAKKAMPSVVGITTVSTTEDFFFGTTQTSGVGTGVIVDERGYILTNAHVVEGGSETNVTVLFFDGSKGSAEVLWSERALDLAVIKVEKDALPVAELGDSDEVEVGDLAIAIGNPLGLEFERSVTQGIISGLNRSIQVEQGQTIDSLMQTDASINPGNSGGPLLNSRGQVIAINSAKVKSGEGLGFAIPINIAKPIVDQFIEKGEFQRVFLGIRGVDLDYYKQATNAQIDIDSGIYVASVEDNSVASRAGIRTGDVVTEFNGAEIDSMTRLIRELYSKRPGETSTIVIYRDSEEIELDLQF